VDRRDGYGYSSSYYARPRPQKPEPVALAVPSTWRSPSARNPTSPR
jgi:hypothetical protein